MPGRGYSASGAYRYGFNGKENDNEVKGEGGQQDYGMRIYDPRLGRFLSVDPIASDYPELTPYQFASNRPIDGIDFDGLEFEDRKAANSSQSILKQEKQHQARQKTAASQKVSSGSLIGNFWRGVKDGYKSTMGIFSSSSIRRTYHNAKGTIKDIAKSPFSGEASKSLTERTITFSESISKSVTDPAMFVSTMHNRSANDNAYGIGYYGFQVAAGYAIDRFIGDFSSGNRPLAAYIPEGRTFNHFTNIDGVTGITGINTKLLEKLSVGESITVNQLSFGVGTNRYLANAVGDNFVTDLGTNATSRQLNGIGVFSDKQIYSISFSEKVAFDQGVRVKGADPDKGIYTIPANSTLKGTFRITKTR